MCVGGEGVHVDKCTCIFECACGCVWVHVCVSLGVHVSVGMHVSMGVHISVGVRVSVCNTDLVMCICNSVRTARKKIFLYKNCSCKSLISF